MQENKINQPFKILRFVIVGGLNTLIDFGIYNLLIGVFAWWAVSANVVSFTIAVINSYFWNKYWTFQDKSSVTVLQFSKFLFVNIIGLLLSTGIVYLGVNFALTNLNNWGQFWQYNVVKAVSVILVWIWNYLAYEYFIFRKSDDPIDKINNNHPSL